MATGPPRVRYVRKTRLGSRDRSHCLTVRSRKRRGRGPSPVIDNGWRHVAESCLSWMDAQEP